MSRTSKRARMIDTTRFLLEVEQSSHSDQVFVTVTDKTNPKIESVVIGIHTIGNKFNVGVPYAFIRETRHTNDGIEIDMDRSKSGKPLDE